MPKGQSDKDLYDSQQPAFIGTWIGDAHRPTVTNVENK